MAREQTIRPRASAAGTSAAKKEGGEAKEKGAKVRMRHSLCGIVLIWTVVVLKVYVLH